LDVAKDDAVLKTTGSYVKPAIIQQEKTYLLNVLKPHYDELILDLNILSQMKRDDNTLLFKMKVKVNKALLESLIMKNLHSDQVILLTLEKNQEKMLKCNMLENDLIRKIKDRGYRIVDFKTKGNGDNKKLVVSAWQGNKESIHKLGRYYLTDLVVVGYVEAKYSEQIQDIYSSHATAQVKIHRVSSGKEIASLVLNDVKGFGSDQEKSGMDAIKKISQMISEDMMKKLPNKPIRQVKFHIREIDNEAAYQKAKAILGSIHGVKTIKDGSRDYKNDEIIFNVHTNINTSDLVKQVAEMKRFVITKITDSNVWLESRKMN